MSARAAAVAVTVGLALGLAGCVRQQLVVRSTPTGAQTWVNDRFVGHTPVTVPFLWYSHFRIRVAADGFDTLERREPVVPPWYMRIPVDLVTTLLPWTVEDSHEFDYTLTPLDTTTEERASDDHTGDRRGAGEGLADLRG